MGWLTVSEWVLDTVESRPERMSYVVAADQAPRNFARTRTIEMWRMRNLTEEAATALEITLTAQGVSAKAERQNAAGAYMVSRIIEQAGRWEET